MKKTLFIIFAFCTLKHANAQTISAGTIVSFAGSVNNSTMSIDYSVGENAVNTLSNSANCITQGFLQPQLIISTGIIEINKNNQISIFPNPTSNIVTINSIEPLTWVIYDALGKLILTGTATIIETDQFAQGIYYLNITATFNTTKTIKLIKN